MNHAAMHHTRVDLVHAAGRTLAEAILDAKGNLLLPADIVLTETALAALRRRGIEQCLVCSGTGEEGEEGEEDDDGAAQAGLECERERALQRLAHLYRNSADQGASAELLRLLTAYRNGARP